MASVEIIKLLQITGEETTKKVFPLKENASLYTNIFFLGQILYLI